MKFTGPGLSDNFFDNLLFVLNQEDQAEMCSMLVDFTFMYGGRRYQITRYLDTKRERVFQIECDVSHEDEVVNVKADVLRGWMLSYTSFCPKGPARDKSIKRFKNVINEHERRTRGRRSHKSSIGRPFEVVPGVFVSVLDDV